MTPLAPAAKSTGPRWAGGCSRTRPSDSGWKDSSTPSLMTDAREVMAARGSNPQVVAYVWDTPLLFEAGLPGECDALVFVEAPRSNAWSACDRAAAGMGRSWIGDKILQWPLDKKRGISDYAVANTADADYARGQVRDSALPNPCTIDEREQAEAPARDRPAPCQGPAATLLIGHVRHGRRHRTRGDSSIRSHDLVGLVTGLGLQMKSQGREQPVDRRPEAGWPVGCITRESGCSRQWFRGLAV